MFPSYTASLQLEHFRLATFASAWQAAKSDQERGAAFADIEANLPKLIKFADGTLIESMIAAAAISRSLLVIQSVVARAETIDPALAARMSTAITSTESLPRAVANAIGAEVQFARTMGRQIRQHGVGGDLVPVFWDRIGRFAFDENDTLNMMVRGYRLSQAHALLPNPPRFADSDVVKDLQSYECPSLGDFSFICAFTGRNPTGRIIALIAFPAYDQYATRTHDVRNLAAATRLTIEARRQGLRGDALSRFVPSAPAGMRDVFTDKPFAYDATKRKLSVELRTQSTVLGDKSYALDL